MKTQVRDQLIQSLKTRFDKNKHRHKSIEWGPFEAKLLNNSSSIKSLQQMELTGGEPDVIGYEAISNQYLICDCSAESPIGRRSLCYDRDALNSRKENKPQRCVIEKAAEMGIELLNEAQYRLLQELAEFDTKTSSWIATPDDVRLLGGALFCDRRYGTVFVYHNSAHSYFAARGFRGLVRV